MGLPPRKEVVLGAAVLPPGREGLNFRLWLVNLCVIGPRVNAFLCWLAPSVCFQGDESRATPAGCCCAFVRREEGTQLGGRVASLWAPWDWDKSQRKENKKSV